MDVETQFNDLGVDATVGIQLMNQLGITPYDLQEPSRFMRFKDVIDHFKDLPDRTYQINRVTIGKNVDRLDHVWGYAELQRQKSAKESKIEEYTNAGMKKEAKESKEELYALQEQLERYER